MAFENRKWVIMTMDDINSVTDSEGGNNIYVNAAIQSSLGTLRKSLDGNKAILKWDGDTPSCFDGMTTYTHSEILTELAKSAWSSDE